MAKISQIKCCGDSAVTVEFGPVISVEENRKVMALHALLSRERPAGIVETVPAYRSLMVHYDPSRLPYGALCRLLEAAAERIDLSGGEEGPVLVLPVLYGGERGPDLEAVAAHERITPEEVVRRHAAYDGRVYMLGFSPGNAYIGSSQPTFSIPRRSTPRLKVPRGAVTVWESQTTIFPMEQPGGWHVIGNTPLRMFQPDRKDPFFLHPGQRVRFQAISAGEYTEIETQVERGTYEPKFLERGERA